MPEFKNMAAPTQTTSQTNTPADTKNQASVLSQNISNTTKTNQNINPSGLSSLSQQTNSIPHPPQPLPTIENTTNSQTNTPGPNASQVPLSPPSSIGPPSKPPPEGTSPQAIVQDNPPFSIKRLFLYRILPILVLILLILGGTWYFDPIGLRNQQEPVNLSSIGPLTDNLERLIELGNDTTISGNLIVEGELTAPNVLYGITAGDNVTISGDAQNPTISASLNEADSLQSVSERGTTTSLRLTLIGGATLGDVLGLATRADDPSGGSNGSLYYNTNTNQFRCYIDGSWRNCDTDTNTESDSFDGLTLAGSTGPNQELDDGDTITIAGADGISTTASATDTITIALALTQSGTSAITSSNSGLEISDDGLGLLRGCEDGDILKWTSATALWECAVDSTGGGGGSLTIQNDDSTIVNSPSVLDFSSDFIVTNSPAGEANIAIDYDTTTITRANQDEEISGTWTFSNSTPIILSSLSTESGSNICINGDNEVVICSGSASGEGLQGAYDDVNTITTTNNRNIEFTLGDTTLDAKFRIVSDPGSTGFMEIVRSDGSATTDPAQLLLVDNQNSARTQAIGIKVQSAAAMTNAIDLSDPEIVNALNVGSNTVTGSGYLITSTSLGLTVNATGSDLALTTTTSGNITATPAAASGLFNVLGGNLRVGTGATPALTLNGEDAFIEGTLEVDGTTQIDGNLTLPNLSSSSGNNLCINGSNVVVQCSGSGVSSVNNLSGALTIANASGAGSTITIDDAEADGETKGIATFSDTNFTSEAGLIDTIQDINEEAAPTFAGLTITGLLLDGIVKSSNGVLSSVETISITSDTNGILPVNRGGTNADNAADARTNLSAAKSGANSDITSLSGLTTALSVAQGGTGATTFTANGVLYGNGTSAIQVTAAGEENQILAVNGSGVPTWTTFTSGGLCSTCMVTNPASTQIVTPTGNNTGIAVRQTATEEPTADIFYVSNNDGSVKFIQVDSDGLVTMNADLDITGTLSLSTSTGILKSNSSGVISSSAVDLASSDVTGTLTAGKGGTGFGSYGKGQILYAAADGTTLSQLAIGSSGQVLTVDENDLPVWAEPSSDVACSSCIVDDPTTSQIIAPTGQDTLGLSVRQTSTESPTQDIFNVTDSAGSTKFLQVEVDGDITIAQTLTLSDLTASSVVFTDAQKGLTSSGTVGVAQGGTGADNAADARSNLSAAKSGANSDITSLTGLTTALDEIYGGTGIDSYTTGDMLYASASNTLAKLGIGSANQVLTVVDGVPTWQTIAGGAGGLCSNCLISDPSQDQIIAPTGQGTIGLGVRQTSTASPSDDIFYVSNSDASSKYIQVTNGGNLNFLGSTTTIGSNLTLTSITSGILQVNGSGVVSAGTITLTTDTVGDYVSTLGAGSGLAFSSGEGTGEGSTPTLAVGAGNGITVNDDDITIDVVTAGTTENTSSNSGLELASDGLSLLRGCNSNQILKWDSGDEIWECANDNANAGTLTGSGSVGRLAKFNTSTDLDNSLLFQANNLLGIGTDFLSESVEPTNFLHLATGNTSTNTVLDVFRIDRNLSSGTAAAGLGAGIVFGLENASGTMTDSGGLRYLFTTATAGSEASDLVFQNIVGGSLAESLRVTSDKRVRFGAKGTTGDPATCTVGDVYFNSTDATFKGCTATNTWEQLDNEASGGGGAALSSITDATDDNTIDNDNYAQTWDWNSLSTQTALSLASSSITSGTLLNVSSTKSSNFSGSLQTIGLTDTTGASTNTGSVLTLNNLGTSNANTTLLIQHNATGTGNLAFRINDVASDTTPFVVDGLGRVGISNSSPSYNLDVAGVSRTRDLITNDITLGGYGASRLSANAGYNGSIALSGGIWTGGSDSVVGAVRLTNTGNLTNIGSIQAGELNITSGGTYATKVDYSTQNSPLGVTAADVNRDGKADIIAVNQVSNSISVLLNNGDGTFASATNYAVGTNPYKVKAEDLNGDGKNDLAVTNRNDGTVSILLNNGDGTFATQVSYSVGSSPVGLSLMDFNGDGSIDVAAANSSSNSVSVLRNNGDGTFASASNYTTDSTPEGLAAGELNGDGKPDIVTTNTSNDTISILMNNGDGTFATKVDHTASSVNASLEVADITNDGKADIIYGYPDGALVMVRANSNGTFPSASGYSASSDIRDLAVADLNGDGRNDVATVYSASAMTVLLANSSNTLNAASSYTANTNTRTIAIADFNGDGKKDVVVTNQGTHNVSVFINNATSLIYAQTTPGSGLGNVGIGDSTPTEAKLVVGGDIYLNTIASTGSYTNALCWDGSGGSVVQDCVGSASADYMEMYPTNDDLEAGDVVTASQTQMAVTTHGDTISKLEKTNQAYQTSVLGIVSDKTKAGDFNSIGYNINEEDFPQPLALSGRVPVKVGSDSESISPGDFITTSSESGKAMKATKPGMMIGKAIAHWEPGSNESTVMIFVNVTYADPQNASYLASSLGVMAPNSGNFASSEELDGNTIHTLTVSDTFKSLGKTMLADTTIAGELTINGTLSISIDNKINAFGTLELQTSPLADDVEVFNGLISLEKSGAVKAKTIVVEEIKVLGGKTAGTGVIKAGTKSIVIDNDLIKANSIISVTPEVVVDLPLAVTNKINATSFKVEIAAQALTDIPFSYLIVNQE